MLRLIVKIRSQRRRFLCLIRIATYGGVIAFASMLGGGKKNTQTMQHLQ